MRTYATDLTEAQWALVDSIIPEAKPGGRPRSIDVRAVVNAIFYLLRTGCQWRLLPREFPRPMIAARRFKYSATTEIGEVGVRKRQFSRTILQVDQFSCLESLTRPIPAPPLIAEAHATLFGDRNRILELDEAALRMRHCVLDGEDHVGLQRSGRVIALISPRLVAGQARRFMTDEAHAMRHKIQIYPVG